MKFARLQKLILSQPCKEYLNCFEYGADVIIKTAAFFIQKVAELAIEFLPVVKFYLELAHIEFTAGQYSQIKRPMLNKLFQ